MVPGQPGRGGVIACCERDGKSLVPAPGGTPLRPVPQPPPAEVIDPGPRPELPSIKAMREPPLQAGEVRAGDAIGKTIRHPNPDYDLVARVLPSNRPGFVELQAGPGLTQLLRATLGVTVVPDVSSDETDPEPLINRQLAARLARQRQP
jgi:hypothetical protein